MKTFRLQLRFLVPLLLILAGTAYLAVPVMDKLTLRWFARDLDMRGNLVANALSDSVATALQETHGKRLQALFDRAVQDERLVAIGLCSTSGNLVRRTQHFPADLTCREASEIASARDPVLHGCYTRRLSPHFAARMLQCPANCRKLTHSRSLC